MSAHKEMPASDSVEHEDAIPLGDLLKAFGAYWKRVLGLSILASLLAYGATYLITPTFTAKTSFLPPQQQGSASSALASLGSLGALAGLSGGALGKSTADQYVAFMQSNRVLDRLIDKFALIQLYDVKFRSDARKELLDNVKMPIGKKDGLITVTVDDHDPARAAAMANEFVDGLRDLTNTIAVSEAQQRRVFFQAQLEETKTKLTQSQIALQSSGFNAGAIKAEPKAAAEGFARLKAEFTTAEIRLQSMRQSLSDRAPEVLQQSSVVNSLKNELARLEQRDTPRGDPEYISKYREYKYQETLFELFARQFEIARVDESKEGALIQVLDVAAPPERKSKPQRVLLAAGAAVFAFLCLSVWAIVRGLRART